MKNTAMVPQIEALSVPGGRGRAACARVTEMAGDLANALRRAVPFTARKRVALATEQVRCLAFADLAGDTTIAHATAFAIHFAQGPRSSAPMRGLVLFDEICLARILDGILGGDGSPETTIARATSAQSALASRVAGSMLKAFADVLATRLAVTVEPVTSKDVDAGIAVLLPISMEGGGKVMLALPLAAVSHDEEDSTVPAVDPGIAEAMADVELDIIAELGRVRLPLETLAKLAIGDVIRLSLPLDERARVCAGGATLFEGRPTASGHVVAVAIEKTNDNLV